MSYLTQRLVLMVFWKAFSFIAGFLACYIWINGYVSINLPFDLGNLLNF